MMQKSFLKHMRAYTLRALTLLLIAGGLLGLQAITQEAEAACACGALLTCSSSNCLHQETRRQVKDFIDEEFENHQDWIEETWWEENLLPALRAMTEQLNAGQEQVIAADSQTQTATAQIATGLVVEEEQFEIINETAPSDGLCEAVTATENTVLAEVTGDAVANQIQQVADANFGAARGSAGASARDAALLQNLRTQCLPQNRAQFPDADCSDYDMYRSAAEALNQGGTFSPDQPTAVSAALNEFVSGFTVPPATNYTPDRFNEAAQLAWQNRRALNASASLAARCYLKSVSGNISVEGTDWTDYDRAAMRQMGMSDQEIEGFAFNAQNHRQYLSMVSNSVQRDVSLVDTPENAQRISLVMQGSNMPILFDTLEQSLCSEMMVSLILNTVTEPLRDAAEEQATRITSRTDEDAARTRFASSR